MEQITPTLSTFYQGTNINPMDWLTKELVKVEPPSILVNPRPYVYIFGSPTTPNSVTVPSTATHILFHPYYIPFPIVFSSSSSVKVLSSQGNWLDVPPSLWDSIQEDYSKFINTIK